MLEIRGQDALRFVDVGGLGGLQEKWAPYRDRIVAIMFEPNPDSARDLRDRAGPGCIVIESGLSNVNRQRTLYITRNDTCCSVHEPNDDILMHYGIWRPHFEVVGTTKVPCARYDTLHAETSVPIPDAIKIDTQGHEYEVLQGFGGLLDQCLAIELESHFYPIYKGQKLLHQIIEFLAMFDFVLRKIEPVPHFSGDVVEVNAFFTKPLRIIQRRPIIDRLKHELICDIWGLERYHQLNVDKN